MKQLFVYVAGPISSDPLKGIREGVEVASRILDRGHFPFVPQLTCFWDLLKPQTYERWMAYDFSWIGKCDALVRLPGVSPGSDREVAHAQSLNIPVFFGLDEFMRSPMWAMGDAHVEGKRKS